jgi:uncharacterized RDD family membrane protein YckC
MAFDRSGDERVAAPIQPVSVGVAGDVLGRRVLAGLIDVAVLAALFVVMGVLFGGTHSQRVTSVANPRIHETTSSVSLSGVPFALFVTLCLAYYFVLELRSGQTLGKRAMTLRVVDIDGGAPSVRAVFLRTLGRVIDVLPLFYLVGLIALAFGQPRQRIGDRLAHTTVAAGTTAE